MKANSTFLQFDYIILGAGASGLQLADALGSDPYFKEKCILLIDKDTKTKNDRTWCFWEKGEGELEAIVAKKWPQILFAGQYIRKSQSINPYTYKMIRGIDFYQYFLKRIEGYSNVYFAIDEVQQLNELGNEVQLIGKKNTYTAHHIFDSRFTYQMVQNQEKYPVLQQHFVGWFVKTDQSVFKKSTATFMDFSILQDGNTRFMYVLPYSDTEALIEYTLFSEQLLEIDIYESAIKNYLKTEFGIEHFEITDKEQGSIPMTCYPFHKNNTDRIFYIGTGGGWAKPSTGYTFYNSVKKTQQLVQQLKTGGNLKKVKQPFKYWFYDLLLLDILKSDNHLGGFIFEAMFKKLPPQLILKFLDEDTTFLEDLRVIWSCPKMLFIKALLKRVF